MSRHIRPRPVATCSHWPAPNEDIDYFVWYTGRECECYLVCELCAMHFPNPPDALLPATAEVAEQLELHGYLQGTLGYPETLKRETTLRFEHWEPSDLPEVRGDWIDVQPDPSHESRWILLLSQGDIATIGFRENYFAVLFRLENLEFEIDKETVLRISPQYNYGAVYQASDRKACIFELESGKITARIDRGSYRPENSHFPFAFFQSDGQTLVVVATEWNRLDIINPASGEVLTDRPSPKRKEGGGSDEHYLDYFHSGLSVSPSSTWIADNGWVWAPIGSVTTWSLQSWLKSNTWESEDGPSRRVWNQRPYFWDGPLCWIDDNTLAIWGADVDENEIYPTVFFYDVSTGREIGSFVGPDVRRPGVRAPKKLPTSLYFDRYLYSVRDGIGTTVWDVSSGECLLQDSSIAPIQYHPASKEFLSLMPNGIRLSRLLE